MIMRAAMLTMPLLFAATSADARTLKEGSEAPNFSGTDLAGKKVTLDSLRGNVVVLNFWATWCGPCKRELPELDTYMRAREKYGFKIVAVTTDANRVKPIYIKQLQDLLSLPLLVKYDGPYEPINRAIPTNYVIDRHGIIRYAKAGALDLAEMDRILLPLLAEPPVN